MDNNIGIKNSWSLVSFAQGFRKMSVAPFVNKESNEAFKSCVFEKENGELVFVAFSSKLGELTPQEIASQKDSLQVVQLASDHYSLCRKGDSTWEEVIL